MSQQNIIQIPVKVVEKITVESEKQEQKQSSNETTSENNTSFKRESDDYPVPIDLVKLPWFARTLFSVLFVFFVIIGATYFWAVGNDDVPY